MWVSGENFSLVFWVAVVPAFASFLLIAFLVHDPKQGGRRPQVRIPISRAQLGTLASAYWWIVAIGAVSTLARFSEAFLILKAQSVGLSLWLTPLVLVMMNIAYALAAYPAGALSDRMDRKRILVLGLLVLVAADLVLAIAHSVAGLAPGILLWGLHMGLTQGLFAALVADTSPPELRGTAFGVFNLAVGLATMIASVVAGVLWDAVGPAATFLAGAGFAGVALAGLAPTQRRLPLRD
jgi:MFS family permease